MCPRSRTTSTSFSRCFHSHPDNFPLRRGSCHRGHCALAIDSKIETIISRREKFLIH
jgi:hypothetical protein